MDFQISSHEQYEKDYKRSLENNEEFWASVAQQFEWFKKWDSIKSGNLLDVNMKWFEGAKLNITYNCLDRHLEKKGDKIALIYEANDPGEKAKTFTYKELHQAVCKTSHMMKGLGIEKGDRVCLYMSMVPELLISVLACARIGAIHSVVFAGFSAKALSERINDADCKLLMTNDGGYRGAKVIPLKDIADDALKSCPTIESVIVHKRVNNEVKMSRGRDHWWHELYEKAESFYEAEQMDAEDPLFILYTSGSTGRPKGVVHTCAGYMVWAAYTYKNVFQVKEDDVYWCTADIGWITGHTYITYGPLLNGHTTVMFEGVPTFPDASRFWQIVDKHNVTHFYTAPTAIRALMSFEHSFVEKHELASLKVLGSVGEPINEEAWQWFYEKVGKKKCPIVDTWWQTETGGVMISNLAGVTEMKPCHATRPLPGIEVALMNDNGNEVRGGGVEGNLCIKRPWPGMARTVYGDHERFINTYYTTYKGYYFTGDGCRRSEEGLYRITGRVDDVINVSGHRIGTAEVEDAINQNHHIIESAVVGYPHDVKGQGIYAYVICDSKNVDHSELKKSVLGTVTKQIGAIAKPDKIQIVKGLPKTRSGKIMRRILRKIAGGDPNNLGDTSTLLDPKVVERIKEEAL